MRAETLSVGQSRTHRLALRTAQGVKHAGAPCTGLSCSFTDTVTEHLPLELAAMNCV